MKKKHTIHFLKNNTFSNILLVVFLLTLIGCSGVKRAQKSLNTGNYNRTIDIAIDKLKREKNKKGRQEFVLLLEDAFKKATNRDLRRIQFLETDNNINHYKEIYELYIGLENRQERIKPLLPLQIFNQDREAVFQFHNYNRYIIAAKNQLSKDYYEQAKFLLSSPNKYDAREAYNKLKYIDKINKGYKDINILMQNALSKGVDYVFLKLSNKTEMVIPKRLEKELLNIDTYKLNDIWTIYHSKPSDQITYDYLVDFHFTDIIVSPERVTERQFIKEKTIEDGFNYKLDADGNRVKDKNGRDIKIPILRDVTCEFYEFTQFKSAIVNGKLLVTENYDKQLLNTFPINSEFIFEHIYATFKGDKRALDNNLLELTSVVQTPFPSNEQMIYDTGEDLKMRLKRILSRLDFNK